MTVQNKKPRTLLEAAFITYGITVVTVSRLTGTNRMRINRLQRGVARARRPVGERIL
ncbi:MAG TPA: hypothetical protein VGQ21_05080 [Thermoanaerobaculia bacterium]|jgi:hypothetical protein|nr:hypothetical protein [Thermoanaerobaculia bacterium]